MENENEETKQDGEENNTEEENPVQEAKDILSKLEEQNKILEHNLERQERLLNADILGGKGEKYKIKKDDNASARELLAGTGFEDELFPVQTRWRRK